MATRRKPSIRRLFSDYCEIVQHSQPGACPSPGCDGPAALSEHGTFCAHGHISDGQGTLPVGRGVDLAAAIVPAVWRDAGRDMDGVVMPQTWLSGAYWLLQIIHKEPILRGPYKTDAEREHELDMCLIDPGTEHIVLIDPGYPPHTWMPSHAYREERMDRLDNLPPE